MKARVDKVLEVILIGLMSLMVINVVWQVFTRYALNSPSSFTTELAGFLLMWLGLLGSAYATGQKLHMSIDLLPTYTVGRKKVWLLKTIHMLIALFGLLVMTVGGGQLVLLSFQLRQTSSTLQIPIGYVYMVLPISGLLFLFYSIHFLTQPHTDGDR